MSANPLGSLIVWTLKFCAFSKLPRNYCMLSDFHQSCGLSSLGISISFFVDYIAINTSNKLHTGISKCSHTLLIEKSLEIYQSIGEKEQNLACKAFLLSPRSEHLWLLVKFFQGCTSPLTPFSSISSVFLSEALFHLSSPKISSF